MKYLLGTAGVVLVVIAGYLLFTESSSPTADGVVCTMDAKICPDGSAVGRVAPNCEFAACPGASSSTKPVSQSTGRGGIQGKVTLGPTCPVVSNPPDPACADKPYQTALVVTTPNSTKTLYTFSSDANGKFSTLVPPGTYVVRRAPSASVLPRCAASKAITVKADAYVTVNLYCDTGIR